MARIIGIDYGTKRVGLARTDPLEILAMPWCTLPPGEVILFLKEFALSEPIGCFVMGDPRNLDNTPAESAQAARNFARKLQEAFPGIALHWVDERFTSKIAARAMVQAGYKKKDRQKKENLDQISASLILKTYLDQKRI